eukprot:364658-Chlamydomonas_euryale.AAC.3
MSGVAWLHLQRSAHEVERIYIVGQYVAPDMAVWRDDGSAHPVCPGSHGRGDSGADGRGQCPPPLLDQPTTCVACGGDDGRSAAGGGGTSRDGPVAIGPDAAAGVFNSRQVGRHPPRAGDAHAGSRPRSCGLTVSQFGQPRPCNAGASHVRAVGDIGSVSGKRRHTAAGHPRQTWRYRRQRQRMLRPPQPVEMPLTRLQAVGGPLVPAHQRAARRWRPRHRGGPHECPSS